MNIKDLQIKSETWLYRGFMSVKRYVVTHKLFRGGWSRELIRDVVVRADAAGILLYDPTLDKVVMIEQFRIGALKDKNTPWVMEIVAGMKEPDETFESLARRETKEEAGLDLLDIMPVCDYWVSPGGSTERISLFCGKVDASSANGIHGLEEEGEDIRVHVIDAEKAFEQIEKNEINNAMSIIALLWLVHNKNKIRQMWG